MDKNRKFRVFLAAVCILTLALVGSGQANTFILTGDYLKVGVSNSGGLIDDGFVSGIQFDASGTGTFPASPPAPDFLRPGAPFEFFSLNVGGANLGAAGYSSGNPYLMNSFNTSGGSVLSSYSMNIGSSTLQLEQTMFFDTTSKTIHFRVQFANVGTGAINDIYYARGLDPDQDVYPFGNYNTINTLGASSATGLGPLTNLVISIVGSGGTAGLPAAVASIDRIWRTDALALYTTPFNDGNGDCTINLAWDLGDLAAGESKEIHFDYNMNAVPLPPSVLLLGSGLLGVGLLRFRRKNSA